ncbi:LysR family transcriptional regulator [Halomonas saccharevitans]|uniref:LysR family transcriptional regulator n=1 Tax=Halomonas saccharevitans TaxID=416872 RepID=A0A1I7C4P3_9GAMM|nr:LysR family transcriptional regulator [Halomonas saccharevitans]MDT8880269.1 LysR family transcriptional regulator [Halomonas saccharevitans]SFT94410.1 transcriptional regulator, LysR family [Halomonas saccharevitans]
MQRWDRVEAFVEVVRLGAFKAAAERLKVSSSHVSRLVSQLENQLGTALLYRTTRRIRLTEAGTLYYQHCHHLFDGFREAEAAIKDLQARPVGLLSLTCATTFGERYLAPLVNDFMVLHPQLEVRLHLTNRQVDIIDEGFDIAIRMGALEDSSLLARRLCERREYVVGSPAYFTHRPQPHALSELAHHRCLVGSRDHWRFAVEGVRREVRIAGSWESNSGPALLDAALKGLGLAQLPDYYVEPHLASGELISVLDAYRHDDSAVWAVTPRHRHRSPKIRQFIDFLVEHIPERLPRRG